LQIGIQSDSSVVLHAQFGVSEHGPPATLLAVEYRPARVIRELNLDVIRSDNYVVRTVHVKEDGRRPFVAVSQSVSAADRQAAALFDPVEMNDLVQACVVKVVPT
jgi:hypothetical protein